MRGWILAALALVGVGLVAFSFLKPAAREAAPAADVAAAPAATPAEANQPPSVVAAPPVGAAPQTPAPAPPETVVAAETTPAPSASVPAPTPPSAATPAPPSAPPDVATRDRAAEAPPSAPPSPAPATGVAETAPMASAEPAAAPPPQPPAVAASTGSVSEDERIIECARTGAWGVAGCPTQEALIARFSRAGSVAFTDPPAEMNVGRSYVVRAAAALGDTLAQDTVKQSAGAGASVQNRAVQLLPSLEAELTGAGFDIRPLQREGSQAVLTGTANEWAWEVRPIEGGERQLTLIVWGQLTLDDARMAPIRVQTVHHSVAVAVDLPTRAMQAVDWVAYHWEAGAGLGALGLAGFGWAAGRKRRRSAAVVS